MRKPTVIAIAVFILPLIFIACSKSTPADPGGNGETKNFFPNTNGTTYKFAVEITDSNAVTVFGSRNSVYDGTAAVGGVTYQVQKDSMIFADTTFLSVNYFRKTNAGVYLFLDTTGLSNTIPDTLIQFLTIDPELLIFSFPISSGKTWPVFKLVLNYAIFNIALVDVSANAEGTENITLNLAGGSVTRQAVKIRYTLKLNIPNPANLLEILTSTYTAYAWLVEDIGPVRWQGNATVLNAFAGGGIDFDDTTKVITQSLTDYDIK